MGGNPFGKKTFWEKTLWFFLEEIPLGETPFLGGNPFFGASAGDSHLPSLPEHPWGPRISRGYSSPGCAALGFWAEL